MFNDTKHLVFAVADIVSLWPVADMVFGGYGRTPLVNIEIVQKVHTK